MTVLKRHISVTRRKLQALDQQAERDPVPALERALRGHLWQHRIDMKRCARANRG